MDMSTHMVLGPVSVKCLLCPGFGPHPIPFYFEAWCHPHFPVKRLAHVIGLLALMFSTCASLSPTSSHIGAVFLFPSVLDHLLIRECSAFFILDL